MTDVNVRSGISLGVKIAFGFFLAIVVLPIAMCGACATCVGGSAIVSEANRIERQGASTAPSLTDGSNLTGEAAVQAISGSRWTYDEREDKMGRGKSKTASVQSLNQTEFDFPYNKAQRASLSLRADPKYGKDVILSLERAHFLCGFDGCTVQVRFGQGKAQSFSASEPADHSTNVLFIRNHDRFVSALKKSESVAIEADFYQEGRRVFEFDVRELKWP